jgi:flagellar motor switch protein FliN/FliY
MADDPSIDPDEVERLLQQSKDEAAGHRPAGAVAARQESSAAPQKPAIGDTATEALDQNEVESLLSGGGQRTAGAEQPPTTAAAGAPAAPTADAAQAAHLPGEDDEPLGQEGIERLLQQAGQALEKPVSQPPAPKQAASETMVGEGSMLPDDIDYLLKQAEQALESINTAATDDLPQDTSAFHLEEFSGAPASTETATLDLIRDVELDLKIELGRTHMYLEDVLKLRKGSVVPLDKLAGDPVDIYVNGRLIARGEVLVLSDNFCVRVAELITGTNASA